MPQATHLNNKHAHTLERIFQHPASHNLEWRDVTALFAHLGTVEEKENGHIGVLINGLHEIYHRTAEKDVSDTQQVLAIRRFLERAGVNKDGTLAPAQHEATSAESNARFVVVINQKETRVFRSEGKGTVPERLRPHDPHAMLHHLDHTLGGDVTSRKPENTSYYQAIGKMLMGAEEVLLMGNGSGASSAMTHLKDYLVTHHFEVAHRIVGELTIDIEALTEAEILREARAFFTLRDGPVASVAMPKESVIL